MNKVEFYHLNDMDFDRMIVPDKQLINLSNIFPLKNDYDKKKYEINQKYSDGQEYVLIVNSNFFTTIKDFVFSELPLLICHLTSEIKISKILINNAPDRVQQAFNDSSKFDVHDNYRESLDINSENLLNVKDKLNEHIMGQNNVKKHILLNLSKYVTTNSNAPLVLAFIGPQGVGKTQMAKTLSDALFDKDSLFREQMSMLTNVSSQDYLFGSDTSNWSFSKKLLQRKSDVLLLDEFNLLNPHFYGAFYQMFDEGKFVDGYYTVDLKKTIIICTANFLTRDDMLEYLGAPLYSRFTDVCLFNELTAQEFQEIAKIKLKEKIISLKSDYQSIVEDKKDNILSKIKRIGTFPDARSLDHILDQLIQLQILKTKDIL